VIRKSLGVLAGAAIVSACSTDVEFERQIPDPLALAAPKDLNADPHVLEVNLEAREADVKFGTLPMTRAWTYNGTVPGPILDATVGDRLIVHFTNRLPEATTVHWHGIRLPANMDGSLAVQNPVEPGGTFRYEFVLKDPGLFWFHPHMRTDVQIEKGLTGIIRVHSAAEPSVDDERVLVLDDIRLREDGTFPTYLDDTSKMLGREGNTILVNGRANATIPLRAGALTRWRIVNVANGRFFNLKLLGVHFRIIGTDGGFIPLPYEVSTLLVAPAERFDVVFIAPTGADTVLTSEPYERGHGSGNKPPVDVANVHIFAAQPTTKTLPISFPPIARFADAPATFPLALDEGVDANGDLVFTINGTSFPNVPMLTANNGSTQVFEITNKSMMDHPFHLLSTNGVATPTDRLANKDTVIVPKESTMKLAARFDEPGTWMYHCHINEHSEGGMMGEIRVH
jgi:FtsP/CotA-like multicopper oxidase with cupredoxin domain